MNVPAVMESSVDCRPAVEDFLQCQDVSHPPGDLSQGEEPVIIHVQGSPQSPSLSEISRGPAIGQVTVDFLPVNYFI